MPLHRGRPELFWNTIYWGMYIPIGPLRMRVSKNLAEGNGHCVFLINSLSDAIVYGCFHHIGRRWTQHVTAESLLIEGRVPLTPGLTRLIPPQSIATVLNANADVIEQIVLEFGSFKVCYVRSGGSGPAIYRRAFFDEVKFELNGNATLTFDQIRELAAIICTELEAGAVTGTPNFAALTDTLPVKVRTFSNEDRA